LAVSKQVVEHAQYWLTASLFRAASLLLYVFKEAMSLQLKELLTRAICINCKRSLWKKALSNAVTALQEW